MSIYRSANPFWLEVLQKVAVNAKLNILLGNEGLMDRVMNVFYQKAAMAGWTSRRWGAFD